LPQIEDVSVDAAALVQGAAGGQHPDFNWESGAMKELLAAETESAPV
jgi:hypothetical protein